MTKTIALSFRHIPCHKSYGINAFKPHKFNLLFAKLTSFVMTARKHAGNNPHSSQTGSKAILTIKSLVTHCNSCTCKAEYNVLLY